jgi:hypothetical protein
LLKKTRPGKNVRLGVTARQPGLSLAVVDLE